MPTLLSLTSRRKKKSEFRSFVVSLSSRAHLPSENSAQVTKRLIEEAGQKCNLVPGDLRTQDERKRLIKAHIDTFGSLDVLVNNASKQIQCKDLKDIDMDNVNDTFQANSIFVSRNFASRLS